jgi:4-hydroxythreonine-4-phosphate dehydrogenase
VIPRIAITLGEPAGVGPDLILDLARREWPAELVVIGNSRLLASRARALGRQIGLKDFGAGTAAPEPSPAGRLIVADLALPAPVVPGRLEPRNARWVVSLLDAACSGCASGHFQAMVTAPVHKAVINDAGIAFTGHTEYLARVTDSPLPLMLLVAGQLRVALATTHLALKEVPTAITRARIEAVLRVLHAGLRERFGLANPRIVVLGLNPHAGEGGHLGREELEQIGPALEGLRADGFQLEGPLPADTAFIEQNLEGVDAVLAMYHDQGLPVLKHRGFGKAVNVTLGLPLIRTSVDHGTALDLAGSGRADSGSLVEAVRLALEMTKQSGTARG